MPVRRHEPVYVSPRATSYGSSHDYGIEDTINRADYLSQSVLQDTYEAAKYSRGKDHALLRNVNAAIVDAPWLLRGSRGQSVPPPDRSARESSVPPRARRVPPPFRAPDPLPTANLRAHRPASGFSDVLRAVRARSLEPSRRPIFEEEPPQPPLPSSLLWAHRPKPLRKDAGLFARARSGERSASPSGAWRYATVPRNFERASDYYPPIPDVPSYRSTTSALYRAKFGPQSKPPRPVASSQAAIIGSRLDAGDTGRSYRRPRSEYALNKLRREESERRYI